MTTSQPPRFTLDDFEQRFADRHLLHATVEKWAREKPSAIALIDSDRNQRISWAEFDTRSRTLAMMLLNRGLRRGDYFASMLPLTSEHILLEYACFRIGVVFVPLDLRLSRQELMRNLGLVNASAFAFLKTPSIPDPAEFCADLQLRLPMKLLMQFAPASECAPAVVPVSELFAEAVQLAQSGELRSQFEQVTAEVRESDGALVIFTTGSTGSPKAALLSHRNISCQAMCISKALLHGSTSELVTLVNLPPSHVGCQTELLMGTLFDGGCAVLVPIFDPARSLRAIADYNVTAIGQIPAMFQFEWRLKEFDSYDLSSLDFAAYGGQQVSPAFVSRVAKMAPNVGTGLGLTEAAGFCTYIRTPTERADECANTLGHDMPVYPMSIREPMQPSGAAGRELESGQLGHVCFKGPQTFLGYVNDPAATASALSSDGYLYTGDIGYRDRAGLHLAGREKLIIKPAGYQVFPGDVENHFAALEGVALCAAVGAPHPIISEAIVAFIELQPGFEIPVPTLQRHARDLASYMRPYHYVLLAPGQMPLNRVAKPDYLTLRERAASEVDTLKQQGRWNSSEG